MRILKGWEAVQGHFVRNKQVITIGSFDGIHRGHRRILERTQQIANAKGLPMSVLTFDTHPRSYLDADCARGFLLHTKREKLAALSAYNIDNVVFLPFDVHLANYSARDYLTAIVIKYFSPAVIVIGVDHRFGKDRQGNAELLCEMAPRFGYEAVVLDDLFYEGEKISSSRIRSCILRYEVACANSQLGYSYTFAGTVVRGNQLGRTIGFPTANIENKDPLKLRPPNGVYAVTITIEGYDKTFYGMMNIGFRPTVNLSSVPVVEVHIFDFDEMIYDKNISVAIHTFIRMEKKFSNKNYLIKQLEDDKKSSTLFFTNNKIS